MELIKDGKNTIYSFELNEAVRNIERGISLETFLKHRAETFEIGKDAYCEMIKKEIEFINQNSDEFVDFDDDGHPFWTFDSINLKEVEKIINAMQKLNIQISEPPPKPFTGAKICDVYDPIKVHKEFKNELKCDYSTFKAWFVDSVICDKQIMWNYNNGNKTQLRSFIYVLCSGWKPAETNTAFKISVNSNDREGKLNSNLLQRIEKCKFD